MRSKPIITRQALGMFKQFNVSRNLDVAVRLTRHRRSWMGRTRYHYLHFKSRHQRIHESDFESPVYQASPMYSDIHWTAVGAR